MLIYVSLLVALVGLVVYALASNPKAAEIGRLMFACGLLVFLLTVVGGHQVATFGRR
jgi:hypothetical protein